MVTESLSTPMGARTARVQSDPPVLISLNRESEMLSPSRFKEEIEADSIPEKLLTPLKTSNLENKLKLNFCVDESQGED